MTGIHVADISSLRHFDNVIKKLHLSLNSTTLILVPYQ